MAPEISWKPTRTVAECEAILTAPGMLHEMELAIIDGRVLRVYKNQSPNLRNFWLTQVDSCWERPYIVFENDRYTYGQLHEKASRLGSVLYSAHGVRKGDRVAIAMRNFPEYIISFWAIHLIGAVSTLINAWAPAETFQFCLSNVNAKVLIVDPERADRIAGTMLENLKKQSSLKHVLVFRAHEGNGIWRDMADLDDTLAKYSGEIDVWKQEPECTPEDNATIFFTSGTTGLPKGVLSSQRGFLHNVLSSLAARRRSILRRGKDIPLPNDDLPMKASLLSVPLFHVTGLTSIAMTCTYFGSKIVLIRRWDKDEAARLIVAENITSAGGVPSMVMDLIETSLENTTLEGLGCGGAPSSDTMPGDVRRRFPNVDVTQGYGLSETNAIAVSIHGEDFLARPASTGLAAPITDLLVVDPATQKVQPPGKIGELWIRGSNVMKGYWNDPAATEKAITRDGWFKSGDLATIDEEGFVFIRDRAKDIIIRGGENIHSVTVENALYADDRLIDAAAVSVPDRRLGELVAAVVSTKPSYHGKVTEEEVIAIARKSLPSHAVPVMVLIREEHIDRNAAGKIMKDSVRKQVRAEWARRQDLVGKKESARL